MDNALVRTDRTRVLVVDDDPLVRDYLTTRLARQSDVEVVASVPDAPQACACLRSQAVDLVLLDYRLGGPDGLELATSIRLWLSHASGTAVATAPPQVLFCTGFATEELEAEARARGASGVLAKSDAVSELLPAIRTVMQGGTWFRWPASLPRGAAKAAGDPIRPFSAPGLQGYQPVPRSGGKLWRPLREASGPVPAAEL